MAAGLPGAGIGALFYIASTVLLPLRSLWRRLAGLPDTISTRELLLQLGIAGGIIGGIWCAGWLLALVVPAGAIAVGASGTAGATLGVKHSVVRGAAIAAGFLTLFAVLAAVEVARLFVPLRRRYPLPAQSTSSEL